MMARVGPAISVVSPFTISWWAWWLVDKSKGDLRSLMAVIKRKPRSIPGMERAGLMGEVMISLTRKEPVAR